MDQKALNEQHAHYPKIGDYWHERFVPICVVCDVTDEFVTICKTVMGLDEDSWTWDLRVKQTLSREAFAKFLAYGESWPGYWADVLPERMPWVAE